MTKSTLPKTELTRRRQKARILGWRHRLFLNLAISFPFIALFAIVALTVSMRLPVEAIAGFALNLAFFGFLGELALVRLMQLSSRAAKKAALEFPTDASNSDLIELLIAARFAPKKHANILLPALKHSLASADLAMLRALEPLERETLRWMISADDAEMAFAAMDALESLADRPSIHYLSRIANGEFNGKGNPEIQQRASECIDAIEQRLRGDIPQQILLRGTEKPVQLDTLLRPVAIGNDAVNDELLRSSSPQFSAVANRQNDEAMDLRNTN